jgi:hypothetical protein
MPIVTTAYEVSPAVTRRQKVERSIVSRAVSDLLAAGYTLAVSQGDERPEPATTHKATIMKQLGNCDEDRLLVYQPTRVPPAHATGREFAPFGWVFLVYGNDGWDVLADFTGNLESVLAPATALAWWLSE